MNGTEEVFQQNGGFLENNYGIKSLLCLAGINKQAARPITSSETLRRRIPVRVLATLLTIGENGTTFSISLNNDPRDMKHFKFELASFYSDPANRMEVPEDNIIVGSVYACEIASAYHRCRLTEIRADKKYLVFLIDIGQTEEVGYHELFDISCNFIGDLFNYGFALLCSTPDPVFLQSLKLPTLDQFCVGDVVDVVICSLHEPCLAVAGSAMKHFERMRPETMIVGFDDDSISNWQSNFSDPEPCVEYVLEAQYQPAQPLIFTDLSFVTVAACNSLESVHVRDIISSIRLSILQEIVNEFYLSDECRVQMGFHESFFSVGLPCVLFDEISQQFVRAKVLRWSSDKSVADVVAVDFPNLYFKEIDRWDIFMLSTKFNVPPQCFSIQLAHCDDKLQLARLTKVANHFLEVGSVVAVSLEPKSTLAKLKCTNDLDVLQAIGYYAVIGGDSPPGVVSKVRSLNNGAQLTGHARLPVGCIPVIITHVRSANAVYYRTSELAKNYMSLRAKLAEIELPMVEFDSVDLKGMKIDKLYLKRDHGGEFHRIRVVENVSSERVLNVRCEYIDSGECIELIEGFDKIYRIPAELKEWLPTLSGPCRLANVTDGEKGKYCNEPSFAAKLRKIFADELRCFLLPTSGLPYKRGPTFCASGYNNFNQETNNEKEVESVIGADDIKQVHLYRQDGTSINNAYNRTIEKMIKHDKQSREYF